MSDQHIDQRACDTDRDATLQALHDAAVAGFITFDELADREALALKASTHSELDRLIADVASLAPDRADVPPPRPMAQPSVKPTTTRSDPATNQQHDDVPNPAHVAWIFLLIALAVLLLGGSVGGAVFALGRHVGEMLLGFTVSRFAFAFSRLAWLKWLKRRDSPGRREVEK